MAALRLLAGWPRGVPTPGDAIGTDTLGPGAGISWSMAAALVVGAATAMLTWWHSAAHALTAERAALWLEERAPRLRFALVTAVGDDIAPPVRDALERAIRAVSWEGPARSAVWRSLRWPALLALLGLAVMWRMPGALDRAGDGSRAVPARAVPVPRAPPR